MKLDELIKGLTEIQEQYGNLTVEIMREGVHFPEIEPYIDGNFLYLEAYEEGEGLVWKHLNSCLKITEMILWN